MQEELNYEQPDEVASTELNNELVELRERLRKAEEQSQNYLTNWQRTQADLENFRKRAAQERREAMDLANSTLLAKLMSALDDLERAFSRPPAEMRRAAWADGARLSFQKLKSALESEGVQQIDAVGQPFDPRFHQAIMRRPGQEGMVLEEAQKGYIMNGRVLRPSMVVVGTQEDMVTSEEVNGKD
jgi:molecular chaperone GrpE